LAIWARVRFETTCFNARVRSAMLTFLIVG
jgi:hypothetical protein